jgi:polysaccharide export outer membrane protein
MSVAGCQTRPAPRFAELETPAAQARPLTPGEWLDRNFTQPVDKAAAHAQPLTPGPQQETLAATQPPAAKSDLNPRPQPGTNGPGPQTLPATQPLAAKSDLNPRPQAGTNSPGQPQAEALLLHEGDVVRIAFPGALNLNTTQQIRRDGKINLPLLGEFKAAGLAPSEMEKQLIELYGPQLQVKEVTVTMESSAFPVYVTGAVLRPGKIMSDRPIDALEAIMEAGGFDYTRANLKSVRVIRHDNGRTEYHRLNLKRALQGQQSEPFKLKPFDIIYVPERLSLF